MTNPFGGTRSDERSATAVPKAPPVDAQGVPIIRRGRDLPTIAQQNRLITYQTVEEGSRVPKVEYNIHDLRAVKLTMEEDAQKRRKIAQMTLDGVDVKYTQRFGTSLSALYGFSPSIFKFFDPSEVVERICERGIGDRIRIATVPQILNAQGGERRPVVLAASRTTKSVIDSRNLNDMLREIGINPKDVYYDDAGIVQSFHVPARPRHSKFEVLGDELVDRFVVETPLDGYGSPSAYLSMLRLVCVNGAIGYAAAFRSQIPLGKNVDEDDPVTEEAILSLKRFVESFDNDEGFAALHDRFDSAAKSWASADEFHQLWKVLMDEKMKSIHKNLVEPDKDGIPKSAVTNRLIDMAGSVAKIYGLASLENITAKQRRKVPVGASVYDLVNLATEVASHHADPVQAKRIQAWVGQTLAGEYDLEGTMMDGEDATGLFLTKN